MEKISGPNLLLFAALAALMSACGGGGSSSAPLDQPDPTPQNFGLLKPAASDEELATALREGMARNNLASLPPPLDFSPAPTAPDTEFSDVAQNFTTTNLQEAGVDEADRVKYDGEVLYVADFVNGAVPAQGDPSALSIAPGGQTPVISLYLTDPDTASTELAGRIEFEQQGAGQNLYVRVTDTEKQLIGVSENYDFVHWGLFADFSFWQSQRTEVRAWIVDDPQSPAPQFSLEIEGALLASRRIGDTLYVITRFSPEVEGIIPYPATEEDRNSNSQLLDQVDAADLLPGYSRDGQAAGQLVDGTDCYVPNSDYQGPETLTTSSSIISVTAINLASPDIVDSICLNGFASGYYVSTQSLYLTTNAAGDKTLIHKVALNDGQPEYRGSGEVVGYLGTSNPSFLMSENGADLRVVSSVWESVPFPLPLMPETDTAEPEAAEEELLGRHHLTILREDPDNARLEQIVRLPNSDRPAHIGKPGEDLYAARFLSDRVYLVTFQVIDPLYVIDLSNPEDPKIEGELVIPGFSTLLQPLEEGLLLGVGSEVSVDTPIVQGVKIALFDVADAQNPIELDSAVIGRRGSYSPALNEHHALTLLKSGDAYRLAVPIQRHERLRPGDNPEDPWTYFDWSDSSLYQFSVNAVSGSIDAAGKLVSEQYSDQLSYPQFYLGSSRSVIHNDAVFFSMMGRDEVLAGSWGE